MYFLNRSRLIEVLKSIDPNRIGSIIEHGISMEKLNLEAHQTLGNENECLKSKHRIADAKIFLLILRGELPL